MNTQDQSAHPHRSVFPKFPQYPRLFPAPLLTWLKSGAVKTTMWLALATAIAINVYMVYPEPARRLIRTVRLPKPGVITQNADVLGATITQRSVDSGKLAALRQQYDYWEGILRTHDDYRDGQYMAALLAYQLNDMEAFARHAERAKALDPNAPVLTTLEMLKLKN